MNSKIKTQVITVTGKVQGVGFRYYVYNLAQQLNIKGWVKNMSDGSVKIVAQGTIDNLYSLFAYIKKGPPLSRVDNALMTDYPEDDEFLNFTIR